MSGHSKWANIKHRKAKQDAVRGKIFTKIAREIIVAAKQGGGDPETNPRLKVIIQKARENNIPNDNIMRTIQKATGELAGVTYEEIVYEGYGPGGVAVMMNIMTDNRNRTAGEIRHIFSKHGGNLGESGCVSWMFSHKGMIIINRVGVPKDEDELMLAALEAGAEDVKFEDETIEIITLPDDLGSVKEALEREGIKFEMAEDTMIPQTTVDVTGEDAIKMLKMMDLFEDHDDVQGVYANFDISDEDMAKLS